MYNDEAPENSPEQQSRNAHNDDRFDSNITSEDLSKYMEGEIPPNTEKYTAWALNNFEAWQKARNKRNIEDTCPENIFMNENNRFICEWLCKFITEMRKSNGEEYTPRSLHLILSGLQRHIRRLQPLDSINLFQDPHYKPLKNVCDSVSKNYTKGALGLRPSKHQYFHCKKRINCGKEE